MSLTSRCKLHLKRQRRGNKLVIECVQININLLIPMNRVLKSKRPKDLCDLAPLRALGELHSSTDTAACAISIVVAVFEVFISGVL